MGRAVRLDIGGVDGDRRINPSRFDQRLENPLPDAPSRPAIEAIVYRGARPIVRRAVSPSAAALERMHDPTDHPSIVNTTGARLVLWQVRIDRCPRLIAQPKQIPHRPLLVQPSRSKDSDLLKQRNDLIGFRP
jgi:hypothetical protein